MIKEKMLLIRNLIKSESWKIFGTHQGTTQFKYFGMKVLYKRGELPIFLSPSAEGSSIFHSDLPSRNVHYCKRGTQAIFRSHELVNLKSV